MQNNSHTRFERAVHLAQRSIFVGDQYSKSHEGRLLTQRPIWCKSCRARNLAFQKHDWTLYDECGMNREQESGSLDSSVGRAFDCSGWSNRIVAGSIPAQEIQYFSNIGTTRLGRSFSRQYFLRPKPNTLFLGVEMTHVNSFKACQITSSDAKQLGSFGSGEYPFGEISIRNHTRDVF